MPSRKIEEQLEKLSLLRREGGAEEAVAAIRKALADPVNVVAAKGAKVAAELGLKTLLPELAAAFARFFENGRKRDPQCWAKNALAKALKDLDHAQSADFLRGAQYVQMEPVWGGEQDTATVLRSTCLLALVQCTDITRDRVFRYLVDAFTDPISTVREDIARAIEQMEGEEAALLLRLKARVGDKEPGVTGQVLESLLRLERAPAVPFVAGFLANGDDLAEEAALALGVSRLEAAVEYLQKAWNDSPGVPRGAILRALSASRSETAIEFLVNIVRDGREREAVAAVDALAFHRESADVLKKTATAVENRSETAIRERFAAKFPL